MPAGLSNVGVDISIVLGRSRMPIHQLLRMGRGAVIALDSAEGDEVEILANDLPIARGMVVVNGTSITVEVKELLKRPDSERIERAEGRLSGAAVRGILKFLPWFMRIHGARAPHPLSLRNRSVTRSTASVGRPSWPYSTDPVCGRGGIGRRASLRC